MPSLNDAIKDEEHNPGCFLPEVRRLYIRQGTKGEQKFVSWGMTCLECGAVVQEHFKPKPLTKAQVKARQEYAREISESIKSLTGRSAKIE